MPEGEREHLTGGSQPFLSGPRLRFLVALILAALWLLVLWANSFTNRGRKSPVIRIVNNLKQIWISKDAWAAAHGATPGMEPSLAELSPYLALPEGSTNLAAWSVMGERYTIHPVGVSPEAELTKPFKEWPAGTIIRLDSNRTHVIVPPGQPAGD